MLSPAQTVAKPAPGDAIPLDTDHLPQALAQSQALNWPYRAEDWAFAFGLGRGFAVETESLPDNARATHISLFDGSLCGLELTDKPAFSVQYHPEASPGPQDSFYLFEKFVGMMR